MGNTPPARPRQHGTLLNAGSDRLPASLPVRLMRWWIPAFLCLIGVVLLVVEDFDGFGVSAFAAFAGAGSSTWLINFLWRLGVSGDDEREREAEDRAYLARNGRWPDDPRTPPSQPIAPETVRGSPPIVPRSDQGRESTHHDEPGGYPAGR